MASARSDSTLDVLVVGAGIGGVIAAAYARLAGLSATVLERQTAVGGLWNWLPPWQDLQIPCADWTLGDIPIRGEDQRSVLANVRAWVDRFDLSPLIRLDEEVQRAHWDGGHWELHTARATYRSRFLLSATGAHNRPATPAIERKGVALKEIHSSALGDPNTLRGAEVVVVGGGASAFDLLDLCLRYAARRVRWVFRTVNWMAPTVRPKNVAGSVRKLFAMQAQGMTAEQISQAFDADLRERYRRFGLLDILPPGRLDLRRQQLVTGRSAMIENYARIERHRAGVVGIKGSSVTLSTGLSLPADVVLWGTGYQSDMRYFELPELRHVRTNRDLEAQCVGYLKHRSVPNLYFLSVGLESTGSAPFNYAHSARTIVAEMLRQADLGREPVRENLNYFELPKFLADHDPLNYTAGWQAEYDRHASLPPDVPLPIPRWRMLAA